MFEFFEDLDFLPHGFDIFLLFAFFFDGFDGDELSGEFFAGLVDFAVRALADEGEDVVVLSFTFGHSNSNYIILIQL